jgi:hypothetical protein
MVRIIFLLLWPAVGFPAEVYRCIEADGSISFQQAPCKGEGARIETGEAQAAWTSLRGAERRLYRAYRKRDRERLEFRRKAARGKMAKRAARESVGCYNKRHALEEVEARLRGGYKPSEGDRLRRRRDYLEGYLRRFCR